MARSTRLWVPASLWLGVLLFYVVGDVTTTAALLEAGYTELNPVVSRLITGGWIPLLFAKIGVVGLTLCVWILWPKPYAHIFPAVLLTAGLVATVNNLYWVL